MINITSDVADIILQNTLTNNTNGLSNAIERMTTGYKINHAKDNAAIYSISTDLSKRISSMFVMQGNSGDAISLLQTAEGGLEQVQDLLERLRALATKASNGNYGTQSREALQAEAQSIIAQIYQIKDTTKFGGLSLYETRVSTLNSLSNHSLTNRLSNSAIIENNTSTEMHTNIKSSSQKYSRTISDNLSPMSLETEGALDFASKETKTVSIAGVTYTIKNIGTSTNSLSYTKDSDTGLLTFNGSYFVITAQKDVAHNVTINGQSNTFYGGDLADTIVSKDMFNQIYGGNGDDVITAYSSNGIYGEAGNDIININCSIVKARGGEGNDTFNVYGGARNNLRGNEGDDTFNIISGESNYVDGGVGDNSIVDNGNGTIKINVPGANWSAFDFDAKETKTLTIDNKQYTVTNGSSEQSLLYKIDDTGRIYFSTSNSFYGTMIIRGQNDVSHKVCLTGYYMTFYGGNMSDDVLIEAGYCTAYGMDGDDTIVVKNIQGMIYGGAGNDKITVASHTTSVWGDDGDDEITVSSVGCSINAGNGNNTITLSAGAYDNSIYGGSGNNNTLVNNSTKTNIISGFGEKDNASALVVASNTTTSKTIGGRKYSISNNYARENVLLYNHDVITDFTSLGASGLSIQGNDNLSYKLNVYGNRLKVYTGDQNDEVNFYARFSELYTQGGNDTILAKSEDSKVYAGEGDDEITVANPYVYVYGQTGNDTLIIKSRSIHEVNGGDGDDIYIVNASADRLTDTGGNNIYHINADNTTVTGGVGADTFYIKGKNNNVMGAGGDDYFVVDGDNNKIDGGTGNNIYVNNGSGTTLTNVNKDPNSGALTFTTKDEKRDFVINGKTYTIINDLNGNNILQYSLNSNTGIVTFLGSSFKINAQTNESALLHIRGNNNIVNGSNLADKIIIEQGSNNIVNGLDGDDILTMESENNSLIGGAGNDTLTLNASTNLVVNCGSGNDNLIINSDNNMNIQAGVGNNSIQIKGKNNYVSADNGANTITISGNKNNITTGDGANKFIVNSDSNIITAGNGANIIGVKGNSNRLTAGNASGNLNIDGNNNIISNRNGVNTINIKGDGNNYSTTSGNKNVIVNGNSNTIQGGGSNDTFNISGNNNIARGGDGNDTFTIIKGNNNSIDGEGGLRNLLYDSGIDTTYTNAEKITSQPFELKVKVDIGSGDDKYIKTKIYFDLLGFDVDLTTQESALTSLDIIDDLRKRVGEQLTNIGSTINRLEYAMEYQTIKLNNLISTRSTLRDADIAKESSDYIRCQILQQASTTLMAASRNIRYENVLALVNSVKS